MYFANNFIHTELKSNYFFHEVGIIGNFEYLNLKRNYVFFRDFKYFFKYFFVFFKKLKKYFFNFAKKEVLETNEINQKRLNSYFFFISESNDFFFYNLFLSLSQNLRGISFLIEWSSSRFFFFLRRKKSLSFNFFPVIFVAPSMFFNKDFLRAVRSLVFFPVFFFFNKTSNSLPVNSFCKNVFPVFVSKKNNLKFLLIFFKLLLTSVK